MSAPGAGPGSAQRPVHAQVVSGPELRQGWDALCLLLSAALVFGLPAWGLSVLLDQRWILPVGLVLGMGAAISLVWFRYGVHRT